MTLLKVVVLYRFLGKFKNLKQRVGFTVFSRDIKKKALKISELFFFLSPQP